jgi:hypothetical protein
MPLPQLITISPNPIPSAPCWVLVCYDFSQSSVSSVELTISFGGKGDRYTTQVTREKPCVPVYIPAGCTGITVRDESGQSQDKSAPVLP